MTSSQRDGACREPKVFLDQARFLLEEARTKLGLDASSGASFLAGQGSRTGAMWRAYLDTFTFVCRRGKRMTIAHAARATFARFTAWIAD